MIRHCVFVKFRADFGPNVSTEGMAKGFDDGFIMDLADEAARDRYLADPAHKAAGSRLVAALEGGRDGLMVFDLKLEAYR
ncbi:MAG: Dabb family protein [Candidatus Devosia euplotis]|nr:Dabb family protein [Candidatus Devosia euplotis]